MEGMGMKPEDMLKGAMSKEQMDAKMAAMSADMQKKCDAQMKEMMGGQ